MTRQCRPLLTLLTTTLLVITPGAGSAADVEMGRLFLSPEQRNVIDRQLAANGSFEKDDDPGVFGPDRQLTIDGEVRSQSGRHTVWINKQARNENSSRIMTGMAGPPGRIVLSGPGIPRTELKVGTTLVTDNPEIADPVADPMAGSRITIHRGPSSLASRPAR